MTPRPVPAREMIPEPTLRRLPWYLAYLSLLVSRGVATISSTRLAEEMDVDSSQIAKDLSYLNVRGKTRIGYEVKALEKVLKEFLGFGERHNAVVIGVGSLGSALIQDLGLQHYGLNIVAGIDTDPAKVGTVIGTTEIYGPDRLVELRQAMDVKVGVITVPYEYAQEVAEACVDAGMSGLWNFTPRRLRVPERVVVQDTSIYSNLAVMYNRLDSLK